VNSKRQYEADYSQNHPVTIKLAMDGKIYREQGATVEDAVKALRRKIIIDGHLYAGAFFLTDAPGIGKTRQILATIKCIHHDSDYTKLIVFFLSVSESLIDGINHEIKCLYDDGKSYKVHNVKDDLKNDEKYIDVSDDTLVIFSTYSTLTRGGSREKNSANKAWIRVVDTLTKKKAEGYKIVFVADECHKAKENKSRTGKTFQYLNALYAKFKDSPVILSSATGLSDPRCYPSLVRVLGTLDFNDRQDMQSVMINPSVEELRASHEANRNKRGRVTTAGDRDRRIGRWVWLNVLVTKESIVAAYVKLRKKAVGQAKGGWAKAFIGLGGRMSTKGWVGKHADSAGTLDHNLDTAEAQRGDIRITFTNRSAWAGGGDQDRIIDASMAKRGELMAKKIQRNLEEIWGSRFRRAEQKAAKAVTT
jgi:hypothetical protein